MLWGMTVKFYIEWLMQAWVASEQRLGGSDGVDNEAI